MSKPVSLFVFLFLVLRISPETIPHFPVDIFTSVESTQTPKIGLYKVDNDFEQCIYERSTI